MISEVYNEDCMEGMKRYPDKFFELAIVDPPYGIGEDGGKRRTKVNRPNSYTAPLKHKKGGWDIKPNQNYFDELFRVSKNQIIWGGNFFSTLIKRDSSCWIVWDKNIGGDQADCELAWTSFNSAVRKFQGHPFMGTNGGKDRIHPTQKPIKLYRWLLKKYANPGDKILDTHMGSQASRIAADELTFHYYGWEIDPDYFRDGCKRFELFKSQMKLQFV